MHAVGLRDGKRARLFLRRPAKKPSPQAIRGVQPASHSRNLGVNHLRIIPPQNDRQHQQNHATDNIQGVLPPHGNISSVPGFDVRGQRSGVRDGRSRARPEYVRRFTFVTRRLYAESVEFAITSEARRDRAIVNGRRHPIGHR
jgi:hypothetical protein